MILFHFFLHDLIHIPKILKYDLPLNYNIYIYLISFNSSKIFHLANKFQIKLYLIYKFINFFKKINTQESI